MIRIRTWKIPEYIDGGLATVNHGMRVIEIQFGPKVRWIGDGWFKQFKGPCINVRWRRV